MKMIPVLAAATAAFGLAACTLNTAPQNPPTAAVAPATIVTTPAPTMMAPPPSSTVVVRP